MVGITCLAFITTNKIDWFIDSGATDHITPHVELLTDIKQLQIPYEVSMPNGTYVKLTHGTCFGDGHITLLDVLMFPTMKFYLISVAKLIQDTHLELIFINQGCYLKDQRKQISKKIGDLNQHLFQFKGRHLRQCTAVQRNKELFLVWHKRLGNVLFLK